MSSQVQQVDMPAAQRRVLAEDARCFGAAMIWLYHGCRGGLRSVTLVYMLNVT